MAFPTRHWRKFTGTLTAGQSTTLAHGLIANMQSLTPDAVHPDMDSGVYTQAANTSIGCYAASTSSTVYISNFDPSNTHYYGVIVRAYHSIDDANI